MTSEERKKLRAFCAQTSREWRDSQAAADREHYFEAIACLGQDGAEYIVALLGEVDRLEAALRDARDWMVDVDKTGPRVGKRRVGEMAVKISEVLLGVTAPGEGGE